MESSSSQSSNNHPDWRFKDGAVELGTKMLLSLDDIEAPFPYPHLISLLHNDPPQKLFPKKMRKVVVDNPLFFEAGKNVISYNWELHDEGLMDWIRGLLLPTVFLKLSPEVEAKLQLSDEDKLALMSQIFACTRKIFYRLLEYHHNQMVLYHLCVCFHLSCKTILSSSNLEILIPTWEVINSYTHNLNPSPATMNQMEIYIFEKVMNFEPCTNAF